MAPKLKSNLGASTLRKKSKIRRKGIHSKTKMSKIKGSKNYIKLSRGQG